jgi:hypothetical protein
MGTTTKQSICRHKSADGKRDCDKPTVTPSAAACITHDNEWRVAHGMKPRDAAAFLALRTAKPKAANKPIAPKRPNSAGSSPKVAGRKRAPAKVAPAVDPMEREIAAVKAMKERDAAKA